AEGQTKNAVLLGGGSVTEPYVTGQWLVNKQHAKKIVYLTSESPSAHVSSDALAASIGNKATYQAIFFPRGVPDPTPYVNQAIAAKADWIHMAATAPDYIKILPLLKAAGFPMDHMLMSSSANDGTVYAAIGKQIPGMYVFTGTFLPFSEV